MEYLFFNFHIPQHVMVGTKYRISEIIIIFAILFLQGFSELTAQRRMEELNRGVVAVRVSEGIFISWRVLGPEWDGVGYNLYRGTTRLNEIPITGGTNFLDKLGTSESAYHVCAIIDGVEQQASEAVIAWEHNYYDLPVRDIPGGYALNDASVGDLDGDGDYEIVVKRISPDVSEEPQYTHLLEAYEMDGTHLWTIDYGPNFIGPQQINFIVYDLDGDGRAEVVTKTSEGTIDGTGVKTGDTDGDGITNYRYSATDDDITEGPEFLSVFDGSTGKEMDRMDYIARDPLVQWGLPGMSLTALAHRADAVMLTVIYADGKEPTLVMCRGIYHRTKMIALNLKDKKFTERWRFDSNEWPEEFRGQGNHSLSVADVDQDGRDEIIYGSMTVDHDGSGLYGTNLGHGDALHVSDMDPNRPGLEVWQALEGGPHFGGTFRDAATGEILIQYFGNRDMGRACAGDITADYPGYEMWGGTECPIYSSNGEILGPTNIPVNFMIWWDGDPLRELLDHSWLGSDQGVGIGTISKYNGSDDVRILTANGTYSINGTKGNPSLSADILGDWREEVIWRTTDNKNLRIYTTTTPSPLRIYTLMHDPQYRLAIAWQNNQYNQPPHPGFFLGAGMDSIPPPPLTGSKLAWIKGGTWDLDATASFIKDGVSLRFRQGDDVLFDILGGESDLVNLSGVLEPGSVTVIAPTNYTFSGPGIISGQAGLVKAGSGILEIRNQNTYSGATRVWEGELEVSGSLLSPVYIKKYASAGGTGIYGGGIIFESGSRLIAGKRESADTMNVAGTLKILDDVAWNFDLSGDSTGQVSPNDHIVVTGDLWIEGGQTLNIHQLEGEVQTGSYTLISYTGSFNGDLDKISVKGVPEIPWKLSDTGHSIQISFLQTRSPGSLVWMGGSPNIWDLVSSLNWLNQGTPDWFVSLDSLSFTDQGIENNMVNLEGDLYPGEVNINTDQDYTFTGPGSIFGSGSLIKDGKGTLHIDNINHYTGTTLIKEGVIEIAGLSNAGEAGPLGAGEGSDGMLQLNGGTLRLNRMSASDRDIGVGNMNGTLDITGPEFRMHGEISGIGQLTKSGQGTLVWQIPNTHTGGTVIAEGSIHLGTEEANIHGPGPGGITFQNATLSMIDDRNSYTSGCDWNLMVHEGYSGSLNLDSRCTLTGSLEGSGTLNLYIPFIRSELAGDWSAFTGRINTSTTTQGGSFLVNNPAGFPGAHIHLGENVNAIYQRSSDITIEIGSISGSSLSFLGAGGEGSNTITWKIGGNNKDTEYKGIICNNQFKNSGASAAIIKTGTGNWTLSNSNTYSGGTVLEEGGLWIHNTEGSGTGSGSVDVLMGASLGGSGRISGPVTIQSGGVIKPGPERGTLFTLDSTLVMQAGSFFAVEVDPINKKTGLLSINRNLDMEGFIYFTNSGEVEFVAGDVFQILVAESISGTLGGILPLSPGEGLQWDTSAWRSSGIISVELTVGNDAPLADNKLIIYPNPAGKQINIAFPREYARIKASIENTSGQLLLHQVFRAQSGFSLELNEMKPGWYILKLDTGDKKYVRKFMKY